MRPVVAALLLLGSTPMMVPYDDARTWLPSNWFAPPVLPSRLGDVKFRPLVEVR